MKKEPEPPNMPMPLTDEDVEELGLQRKPSGRIFTRGYFITRPPQSRRDEIRKLFPEEDTT